MNKKSLLIIVAVLIAGAFLYVQFAPALNKSKPRRNYNTNKHLSVEPQFKKEGNLWFVSPTGDTLSEIEIEVADNNYETTRGLMDRSKMEMNRGMLFIFADMAPRSFWMKNTHFSLDIIYVRDDGTIDSIKKYTEPFSEKSIPSDGKARYVVEVNAGYCDQYGIDTTTRVVFKIDNKPAV